MLGVRSWITLTPIRNRPGEEEALCLWLNSTVGMLLRVASANRPYLGRSAMPHERAREMPVLDVTKLTQPQLDRAKEVFESIEAKSLQGFAHLAEDPVRRELDRSLAGDVLGISNRDAFDSLSKALNREPTMTARH